MALARLSSSGDAHAIRRPAPEIALPKGQVLRLADGAVLLDGRLGLSREPLRIAALNPASVARVKKWISGEPVESDPASQRLASHLLNAGILVEQPLVTVPDLSDITVVIPVRNDQVGLDAVLASVRAWAVRIIVVDDGSDEAVTLEDEEHRVVVLRHSTPRGPAAARNTGFALATTPWVLFVDSDVDLEGFNLERFASWRQRSDVAVVAPRVLGTRGPSVRERFDHLSGPLDLGAHPGRIGARRAVPYVPTATLLLRREICDVPFREDLQVGEDVDFIWRLDDAGWNLLYRPEHQVTHRTRPSWSTWLLQRYSYARAAAQLSELHGDAAAPLRGSALTTAAWLCALAGVRGPSFALFAAAKRRLDTSLARFDNSEANRDIFVRAALLPGPSLARQIIRTYGPALLVASLVSKRIRRFTVSALLLGGLDRWWHSPRNLDPLRYLAVSSLEDLTYATGVGTGAIRARSSKALMPRLTWRVRS